MKLRNVWSILIAICLVITLFSIEGTAVKAETTYMSGYYSYILDDSGIATITKYSGNESTITVPDQIDGNTVNKIGESAFQECSSLVNVTIPDSVVIIGESAFQECSSLVNVTIPDSVVIIGKDAFYYCVGLENINISGSVTTIGDFSFAYCTSLKNIYIPNSVISIGDRAFGYCGNLVDIKVDSQNTAFSDIDGNLYNKTKSELIQYAPGKKEESFLITDSITSIGDWAFASCINLKSVDIPSCVNNIGVGAFDDCKNLTDIAIPETVTVIDWYTFSDCHSLTEIEIPNSITKIYGNAFAECENLKSVKLGENLKVICQSAFSSCGVENLLIPNNVSRIDSFAFCDCKNLKSVKLSDNIKVIDSSTFRGCTSLIEITLPTKLREIGQVAFGYCENLRNLNIPYSVEIIGDWAFYGCDSLLNITIPYSVMNIGRWAFGYDGVDVESENSKLTAFTISGYSDTVAETYAQVNGFQFISLGNAPDSEASTVTPSDQNLSIKENLTVEKSSKKITQSTVVKKLSGTKIKKITKAKRSLKIVWKKIKNVNGYQIQYSTSKKFKKAKLVTVKKAKVTSKTIKKLKSNKKYYIRIRTYITVNGKKKYSGWSKTKSQETK